MRKKIIQLSFVFVLAVSILSVNHLQVSAAKDDITGIKLEEEMRDLIQRGIMEGYGEGEYRPGEDVTRGQFTALVARALKLPEGTPSFPDVKGSSLAEDIDRASSARLVQGYKNGNFGINDLVTREQMAQIIDKSLKYLNVDRNKAPLNFKDTNEIRQEFKDAVSHNVYDKIILGFENGEFQPKKTATRAEAAAFISRMLHISEEFQSVDEEPPVPPITEIPDPGEQPAPPITETPDPGQPPAPPVVQEPAPKPAPPVVDHAEHVNIMGKSVITAEKMSEFVKSKNPSAQDIDEIAKAFYEIGNKYNVRGDIAFAQAILETGWFRFDGGTAVTPDQHNYGGLGVVRKGVKGHEFSSVKEGVTASIQHLFAYASKKELPVGEVIVDPRFELVSPRGKAPHWEDLSGKWAADRNYGTKILTIYEEMKTFK